MFGFKRLRLPVGPLLRRVSVLLLVMALPALAACQSPVSTASEETLVATPEPATADNGSDGSTGTAEIGEAADDATPDAVAAVATVGPPPSLTPLPTTTVTLVPTVTPTSLPQFAPVLESSGTGNVAAGLPTPPTAVPSPVPLFDVPLDTTNILLLGSDAPAPNENVSRTDTMIIVSINRTGPTASIMSLPRDLYVYVPGRTMSRLNTALPLGGIELLKQTILYNFGVPIHYYARVDFEGFQEIVDVFGGVEITVSCQLRDWRLKSPGLDINVEENWEQFTLEPGVHQMDGDLALWYARSRLTTNDFDRGRRQQQLLRAMLDQGLDLGLLTQVPTLWNTFQNTVETDMDIGRMLQIAALAPAIRENGIQHLYLWGKTQPWTIPDSNAQVQLPIWDGPNKMKDTFQRLFRPPALNRAQRAPIFVEVINATDDPELALLAADNLAWFGFVPVIGEPQPSSGAETEITLFAPNNKESFDWLLSWVFKQLTESVRLVDEPYPYKYRVILGDDYDPCRPPYYAPEAFIGQ
jgi:LCP family protein required for cell wall assembly